MFLLGSPFLIPLSLGGSEIFFFVKFLRESHARKCVLAESVPRGGGSPSVLHCSVPVPERKGYRAVGTQVSAEASVVMSLQPTFLHCSLQLPSVHHGHWAFWHSPVLSLQANLCFWTGLLGEPNQQYNGLFHKSLRGLSVDSSPEVQVLYQVFQGPSQRGLETTSTCSLEATNYFSHILPENVSRLSLSSRPPPRLPRMNDTLVFFALFHTFLLLPAV